MSGGPLLALRLLDTGFPRRPVVRGVDLEVRRGDRVALIGANAAGKTTLLRTMAGMLPPLGGECLLLGAPAHRWPARERARVVAVVQQELSLPFAFTVEEVVAMGRFPHQDGGVERAEDRAAVERALAAAGMAALRGRVASELSGGERQRTALARAIAQEPRLLLLDEPTAHLDIAGQVAALDLVVRLAQAAGVAAVAALHDLNLAARFFERLVLLGEDRVLAAGSPAEVLRPDLLERAYGIPVTVTEHPVLGGPLVVGLPDSWAGKDVR